MLQKLHTLVRSLRCFLPPPPAPAPTAALMLLAEPELPTLPGAIPAIGWRERESLAAGGKLGVDALEVMMMMQPLQQAADVCV